MPFPDSALPLTLAPLDLSPPGRGETVAVAIFIDDFLRFDFPTPTLDPSPQGGGKKVAEKLGLPRFPRPPIAIALR